MTPHPSEYIREEMKARGWSLRDLVFNMRRYESEEEWGITCLAVEMYMTVTDDPDILIGSLADGFATAFGAPPEFFQNLHEAWRKWTKEAS